MKQIMLEDGQAILSDRNARCAYKGFGLIVDGTC